MTELVFEPLSRKGGDVSSLGDAWATGELNTGVFSTVRGLVSGDLLSPHDVIFLDVHP